MGPVESSVGAALRTAGPEAPEALEAPRAPLLAHVARHAARRRQEAQHCSTRSLQAISKLDVIATL